MKVIDFVAREPGTRAGHEKLAETLRRFATVRAKVRSGGGRSTERLVQREIADECDSDSYMVEDVVRGLFGLAAPTFSEYLDEGFWTLGRSAPQFGTPWAAIQFDDCSDSMHLLIRYGGSFADAEDPPNWVTCDVTKIAGVQQQELSQALFVASTFDIWLREADGTLYGKLVIKSGNDVPQ